MTRINPNSGPDDQNIKGQQQKREPIDTKIGSVWQKGGGKFEVEPLPWTPDDGKIEAKPLPWTPESGNIGLVEQPERPDVDFSSFPEKYQSYAKDIATRAMNNVEKAAMEYNLNLSKLKGEDYKIDYDSFPKPEDFTKGENKDAAFHSWLDAVTKWEDKCKQDIEKLKKAKQDKDNNEASILDEMWRKIRQAIDDAMRQIRGQTPEEKAPNPDVKPPAESEPDKPDVKPPVEKNPEDGLPDVPGIDLTPAQPKPLLPPETETPEEEDKPDVKPPKTKTPKEKSPVNQKDKALKKNKKKDSPNIK